MKYTKTEIIKTFKQILNNNVQFYVANNGDLQMSFEGKFCDNIWKSGTFINK